MAKKARLTVFSRFLIMMLIVGPLAYLGAAYYNGEDGIENIKNIFNGNKETTTQTRTNRSDVNEVNKEATYEIRKLKEDLEYKDKRIEDLREENEELKDRIKTLEKQLGEG